MLSNNFCNWVGGIQRDVHVPVILEGIRPPTKRLVMVHYILQNINTLPEPVTIERVRPKNMKSMK